MSVSVFCVLIFSGTAALQDLSTRKVSNTAILCGWFMGIGLWLGARGYGGVAYWLSGSLGLLFLGLGIYLLRGIGAGDVKLLSVAGGILGLYRGLWLYVAALFLGGLLGLAAALRAGDGLACVGRIVSFVRRLLMKEKPVLPEGQGIEICYAVAVFGASCVLAVKEGGWMPWWG